MSGLTKEEQERLSNWAAYAWDVWNFFDSFFPESELKAEEKKALVKLFWEKAVSPEFYFTQNGKKEAKGDDTISKQPSTKPTKAPDLQRKNDLLEELSFLLDKRKVPKPVYARLCRVFLDYLGEGNWPSSDNLAKLMKSHPEAYDRIEDVAGELME